MEALAASAALFEVSVPEYKQLKMCRKELRLLKDLWDMVTLVRAQPCFQARAGQQAAHGWQGHPAQVPSAGTWHGHLVPAAIANQSCRAVAAFQRAHCHQREDEPWGRLLLLEQVCVVCA